MKWGEKKPEREEKEEEERSGRKVGPGLNGRELGASHSGAELGAKIYGTALAPSSLPCHLPSPRARRQGRWRRAKGLFSEFFPPGIYL